MHGWTPWLGSFARAEHAEFTTACIARTIHAAKYGYRYRSQRRDPETSSRAGQLDHPSRNVAAPVSAFQSHKFAIAVAVSGIRGVDTPLPEALEGFSDSFAGRAGIGHRTSMAVISPAHASSSSEDCFPRHGDLLVHVFHRAGMVCAHSCKLSHDDDVCDARRSSLSFPRRSSSTRRTPVFGSHRGGNFHATPL